jgi:hypothetical protein
MGKLFHNSQKNSAVMGLKNLFVIGGVVLKERRTTYITEI